jgi:hypothetical protein
MKTENIEGDEQYLNIMGFVSQEIRQYLRGAFTVSVQLNDAPWASRHRCDLG